MADNTVHVPLVPTSHEAQMQLKHMTAQDIAYFLDDHPEVWAVVSLLLELEDERRDSGLVSVDAVETENTDG